MTVKATNLSLSEANELPKVALKHDQEKIRLELLPTEALEEVARVLTFGALKYDDNNWRNGFNHSRLHGAILRHLSAWNKGEDLDPESGLPHIAHAACGTLFLLEHILKGLGKDDRYKYD